VRAALNSRGRHPASTPSASVAPILMRALQDCGAPALLEVVCRTEYILPLVVCARRTTTHHSEGPHVAAVDRATPRRDDITSVVAADSSDAKFNLAL
jgi:hypothetical protein